MTFRDFHEKGKMDKDEMLQDDTVVAVLVVAQWPLLTCFSVTDTKPSSFELVCLFPGVHHNISGAALS